MQSSHLIATETPTAMSSLVLRDGFDLGQLAWDLPSPIRSNCFAVRSFLRLIHLNACRRCLKRM
jgi:hypothetical protein